MKLQGSLGKIVIPIFVMFLLFSSIARAHPVNSLPGDSGTTSSFENAIAFIDKIDRLDPSPHWPNIKPALFLQNLKTNVHQRLSLYQGRGTNFCGYGAVSHLLLQDDPLGYLNLLLQLYRQGKATYNGITFEPSSPIRQAAGSLKFKGVLDIRPAEQMWYLCMSDYFKGYLNTFNRKYDPGDEDTFWAAVNYAKFNRMIRQMLHYHVNAKGADIYHPHVGDLYQYISEKLTTGSVVLFINNRLVHKKDHTKLKLGIPTHFIVLQQILKKDDVITLVYWDYGGKTLMQLSPAFLKKITFGISHCTKKTTDAR